MTVKTCIQLVAAAFIAAQAGVASTTMKTIGSPGNAPDTSKTRHGRGRVDYVYRLATAPVSNADYADFLNAVDKVEDQELYDPRMAISRKGQAGRYRYAAESGCETQPVTFVSYANAASYCNWLSKGSVYEIIDRQVTRRRITRPDSGEVFFIPSRDEWYKGMYYKNGHYDYGEPLKVAEMISTRHGVWHRIAVGHSHNPEAYLKCNNYTNNYSGKSEDNVRAENIGFRVASMPDVHFCPELNSRFNFFYLDQQDVHLKLRTKAAVTATIQVTIRDVWQNKVYGRDFNLALKPGMTGIGLGNVIEKSGYYTLKGAILSQGQEVFAMDVPLVVMDRKQAVVRKAESPFGVSTHLDRLLNCWGRVSPDEYTPILEDLGSPWIRTDLPWKYVTGDLVEKGFHILSFFPYYNNYTKFDSPFESTAFSEKWAKHGVPPELATYAEKCYNLVKDFPHVKSWEVGNEPHGWKISPADYAQMVKAAYKAAKLADPQATVVAGDMEHIHQSVLAECGAAEYSDAVAIHTYGFFKKYHEGVIDRIESLTNTLTSLGLDQPVWVTEISGCGYWNHIYPGKTEEERLRYQALDMPKKLAGSITLGAQKVFVYELISTVTDGTEGEFGLVRQDLLPKPAFMAYRTTAMQLDDMDPMGFVAMPKKDFTGLLFGNPRKKTALLWKEDQPATLARRKRITVPMVEISAPETLTFKAAGKVTMVDIMGVETELPVENGRVGVPVNEYPVFVNGEVDYDRLEPIPAPVAKRQTPAANVQILPPLEQMHGPNDLHNMQHVVRIKLERETPQFLDVRVHNQSKKDQTGKLYLVEPGANSDAGWIIKPRIADIMVPAESTATVRFNINILRRPYTGEAPYILKAVFESDNGTFENHVIVYQMIKRDTDTAGLSESDSFKKATGDRQYSLDPKYKHMKGQYRDRVFSVDVSTGVKPFVILEAVTSPIVSEGERLDGVMGFAVRQTSGLNVAKINLRLVDREGEVFQYQRVGKISSDKWVDVKFDLTKGPPTLSWGKKKNGRFEYPVRWQSIVIDFQGESGEISVSPVTLWRTSEP